jgi:hypothetical protein
VTRGGTGGSSRPTVSAASMASFTKSKRRGREVGRAPLDEGEQRRNGRHFSSSTTKHGMVSHGNAPDRQW